MTTTQRVGLWIVVLAAILFVGVMIGYIAAEWNVFLVAPAGTLGVLGGMLMLFGGTAESN